MMQTILVCFNLLLLCACLGANAVPDIPTQPLQCVERPAPGRDGRDGLPGAAGTDGRDGLPGAAGTGGRDGLPGAAGTDGRDGLPGRDGEKGLPGNMGATGEKGNAGVRAAPAECPACAARKIHQCTWDNAGDEKDSGLVHQCSITKLRDDTGLHVRWIGSIRNIRTGAKLCSRWHIAFNGNECGNPARIDAQLYSSLEGLNIHRPSILEGICYGLSTGIVNVQLYVGDCRNPAQHPHGDSYTSWDSVSRMIIEEIPLA
ncbi:PREDICTED: collagen triple helix repeat-containing protein 1-like isoform X2 [Priapulus caudatus]|uniref:Collagen triple helix repeat-containing protein 1-like isoform X2 n=1 Tax=Priapulus caudatus TaxID=37621 RepID=A0ABM1EQX6_PRICU|nr:PREDICTED: collagen triple helix repeat-containing protein 1-like isoform X2 [Priapulus caudatus]